VSMYDHMYQRGYVRNVPGAPMCGCVEKMPIVSRSDCTEIEAHEFWRFDWSVSSQSFTASLDRAEIDFNACRGAHGNNDLESFYQRLYNEGRATWDDREKLRRTIVGNDRCYEGVEAMMFDKGFEEYYPPTLISERKVYSIKIYEGTNSGKDYLFSEYNGDVKLVESIRNDAARWRFEALDGSNSFFNIRPLGNVESDETYLNTNHYGGVDMYGRDDDSGRQKWHLTQVDPKYVMGQTNVYNIMMTSGTRNGENYLSTNTGGNPDLYDMDDLSGRQRWVIEPIGDYEGIITTDLVNVARGKPTSQSSTAHGGVSSRAVDGNTEGNWHFASVTHTNHEFNPWWSVNLLSSHTISTIKVYGRTDCCMDRLNDFQLIIWSGENQVYTYNHSGSAQSVTTISLDTSVSGDKVEIRLPGSNRRILSLAEVLVYEVEA